jgi:hypothetical protein
MMRLVGCLYVCLSSATLPAVASEPPAQQVEPAQATSTTPPSSATEPSSTAQTPSKPASKTKPASSTSAHTSNTQDLTPAEERLISQGYRLEVKNGQKTFCRREVVLGSHFEKKVCGTAEQLAQSQQTSREVIENTQLHHTNPMAH